jgi:hypothetical protein
MSADADLDRFRHRLPYASEIYGVCQPLLGWRGRQCGERVDRERIDNWRRLQVRMTADSLLAGVAAEQPQPLGPDAPLPPRIPDWLGTAVSSRVVAAINEFQTSNGGVPPATVAQWAQVLAAAQIEELVAQTGKANPSETRLITGDTPGATAPLGESVAGGTLLWFGRNQLAQRMLPAVFLRPPSWNKASSFVDPIASFGSEKAQMVLSPIAVLHLFHEYFFEFDTFLGSPVGHVWVSPGGTLELFEVNTRRALTERQVEQALEVVRRSETTTTTQDELSDAIKQDNQESTNLGITAHAGGNWGVFQAEGSTSYSVASTAATASEAAHKQMRQQSERLATEIRRSLKTTFRSTLEVQDTSSRRHVIQNPTDRLQNYELRRKMRQVGVQVQHLGVQLCWQVYIDDPGAELGIAELVHVAKTGDLAAAIDPPEAPTILPAKDEQVTVQFDLEPSDADDENDWNHGVAGDDRIVWEREYPATPPAPGYTLAAVREVRIEKVDPGEDQPRVGPRYTPLPPDRFRISLDSVNFNEQPAIRFVVKLIWNPPDQSAAFDAYKAKVAEFTERQQRAAHAEYVEAIRERIKLASNVPPRSSDDLRQEERTVVFRRLIRQLSAAEPNQEPHVTAELTRSLFDVDRMLYFVAAEWWRPRARFRQQVAPAPPGATPGLAIPGAITATIENASVPRVEPPVTPGDTVSWGGADAAGRDNYLITEDSQPAPMGASLGWLLQLDGDAHRNAFLNSPWVKAVIPIRFGHEAAALDWLTKAHVEGTPSLDQDLYAGPEPELRGPEGAPNTIRRALEIVAHTIADQNTNVQNVLQTEKVFTEGFDPLEGGFRAPEPFEVFDQWIEVLPTDQVVAVEYDPAAHGA